MQIVDAEKVEGRAAFPTLGVLGRTSLGPFRITEAVSRSDVRWPERYLQIYQGTCAAFVRRTMHTRRALVLGLLANSISSLSKPERSGSGTGTL